MIQDLLVFQKLQGFDENLVVLRFGGQTSSHGRLDRKSGIPVLDAAATPEVKLNHIPSIQKKSGKVIIVIVPFFSLFSFTNILVRSAMA